jgi:hypothetical protein
VKLISLFALMAAFAFPESHPSWWTYASPEATALVGIQWDNLRNSPFAPAIEAELSSTGPLGFPDLDCLHHAREIIISSPDLLAAEAGSFPAAVLTSQAQRDGLRRVMYKGLTLWLPEKATALGVAQISEQLVLVGARKTLQAAIDRSLLESGRTYSSLLPKAAHFSQTGDLWVVAVRLPDPLAGLFVPLDAEGYGFMGQVSVRGGLFVEASFDASSTNAAAAIAAKLEEQAQSLPPLARALQATSDRRTVNIQLQATAEELAAAVLPGATRVAPSAPPVPAPPLPPAPAPVAAVVDLKPVESKPVESRPLVEAKPPEPKPAEPQIIRITGLDDGPREIRVPPVPNQ